MKIFSILFFLVVVAVIIVASLTNASTLLNKLLSSSLDEKKSLQTQNQNGQDAYILPCNNEPNPQDPSAPNYVFTNIPTFYGENSTGRSFVLKNPLDHWSVNCDGCNEGSCPGIHETVSVQAQKQKCLYATNMGPFSFTNGSKCFGPLVSNGKVISHAPISGNRACFGIFKKSSRRANHWFLGSDSAAADRDVLGELDQLVCGFQFLIIAGKPIYSSGTEVAPRTAVGVDRKGNLISLVADGAERHTPLPTGLTMNQTADWMKQLGAEYAVNMDGGGSSTTWFDGKVRGCPTGIDIPICLEREVITIQCVK